MRNRATYLKKAQEKHDKSVNDVEEILKNIQYLIVSSESASNPPRINKLFPRCVEVPYYKLFLYFKGDGEIVCGETDLGHPSHVRFLSNVGTLISLTFFSSLTSVATGQLEEFSAKTLGLKSLSFYEALELLIRGQLPSCNG